MPRLSKLKFNYLWLLLFFVPVLSFAASNSLDLGGIAQQVAEPIKQVTKLVHIICLICGVTMVFSSLLKYKAHRNNPQEVPISTPIMLMVFGLGLIALAILPPILLGKNKPF